MIKEKDAMKLEEREVHRENGMSRLEDMGGVLYILIKSKIKKIDSENIVHYKKLPERR